MQPSYEHWCFIHRYLRLVRWTRQSEFGMPEQTPPKPVSWRHMHMMRMSTWFPGIGQYLAAVKIMILQFWYTDWRLADSLDRLEEGRSFFNAFFILRSANVIQCLLPTLPLLLYIMSHVRFYLAKLVSLMSLSRNEPFIVSGGDDGVIKIWDLRQFQR